MRIDFRPSGRYGQRDIGRQFQPRADADHQIGVRPQPVGRRHRQPEFMRVGDDAAAAAERHHRRVDHFGELEDFLARVDRAAADEDHRPLAAGDQRGGRLDAVRVGLRGGEGIERLAERRPRARWVNTSHGISSDTGPRRPDSISWNARDTMRRRGVGIFDALRPFDEGAQRRELVRHLVQMAAALAEERGRHLAGQAQHRLVRSRTP